MPFRNNILLIVFALLLAGPLSAQKKYTPQTVPNPTGAGGGYVSNPDNILSPAEVMTLNAMLSEINDSTTAQIGIAVLHSIGEEVPETFAYQLFNHWKIGQKDKNNGLLILLVLDQRAWKIETGYGLEGILPDVVCKRIGEYKMVPYFKNGEYGRGIIEGVTELQQILEDPAYAAEIRSTLQQDAYTDADYTMIGIVIGATLLMIFGTGILYRKKKVSGSSAFPIFFFLIASMICYIVLTTALEVTSLLDPFNTFLFYYFGLSLLVLVIRMMLNSDQAALKEDALNKYTRMKKGHTPWFLALLIFPVTFVFYFLWYAFWNSKKKKRFAPRTGKITGKPLRRLSEKEEDRFLKKEQLTEEKINSVDYDVWISDDLQDIEILEYINHASGYKTCPGCQRRTQYTRNRTISAATYSRSGEGERTYSCKNCSYVKKERYTIPQKVQSSSSGSGGGSSFGGSSGGSSFGGGSSGGGGSGGRW